MKRKYVCLTLFLMMCCLPFYACTTLSASPQGGTLPSTAPLTPTSASTPDLGDGTVHHPLKISACLDTQAQSFGTWYVSLDGGGVQVWNFNEDLVASVHAGTYVQVFGIIYQVVSFQLDGKHHATFRTTLLPHQRDECR